MMLLKTRRRRRIRRLVFRIPDVPLSRTVVNPRKVLNANWQIARPAWDRKVGRRRLPRRPKLQSGLGTIQIRMIIHVSQSDRPHLLSKVMNRPQHRRHPHRNSCVPRHGVTLCLHHLQVGFMSYASPASPFASVKGQNVFSSAPPNNRKPSTSPPAKQVPLPLDTTSTQTPFTSPLGQSSFVAFASSHISQQATPSTATKRTGFEAFAGSASPFATASPISHARSKSPLGSNGGKGSLFGRSKSPTRRTMGMNASTFSSYANEATQAFVVPLPKRARAGSPNGGSSRSSLERKDESVFGVLVNGEGSGSGEEEGDVDREGSDRAPSTFGERLRASKDGDEEQSEEEKEKLTEQEGEFRFF